MTKLIVRPLDPNAPGSYRERKALMALAKRFRAILAMSEDDPERASALVEVFDAQEQFLLPRLSTDDGTPVDEVLDRLSAVEFDQLLSAAGGTEAVPPENASS